MSYADWLQRIQPPWLHGERGQAWARALGSVLDGVVDGTVEAVQARHPGYAPQDALALIGEDRAMPAFPGELLEVYRERLRMAFAFWQTAGTLPGMLFWLQVAGYQAHVREHYLDDRGIWAEFSVWLWPRETSYITDRWDDGAGGWDDGTPWEYSLGGLEISRIPGLIREAKPAHAKPRGIWYVPGPYDAWDDGGRWNDGGNWGSEAIQIPL